MKRKTRKKFFTQFLPDQLHTLVLRMCMPFFFNFVVCLFSAALIVSSCNENLRSERTFFELPLNANPVRQYGLLEVTYKHNGEYRNKFFDVTLEIDFTSPSGGKKSVKGFYYGDNLWKVRFRPGEPGLWNYVYIFHGKGSFSRKGKGSFRCRAGDADGQVFRNPENPYRWAFCSGKPYFPVGLQDCVGATKEAHETGMFVDGDVTRKNPHRVSIEEYFSIYGKAGFNLFRFSQKNCSYVLYDDLDHYRLDRIIATDTLLSTAREQGFRIMFGIFGAHGNWTHENQYIRVFKRWLQKLFGIVPEAINDARNYDVIAKEKRFIDYCVARWGAYVDFWELLNERHASDEWTYVMSEYLHSVDPDRKPVSTSWEKPHVEAIDINAPHWYESESELESDLRIKQQADKWKQSGKPVIVGEQGNWGINWDALSGLRMRIRTWTSLFQEISLIFWNTSWSKRGAAANIYLGPEERNYIRILQDFTAKLDANVSIVPITVSFPSKVRAFGLASNEVAAVYLHHFENHIEEIRNLEITLDLPHSDQIHSILTAEWIDPSTGYVLKRIELRSSGSQTTLEVPSFKVDLALLVSSVEISKDIPNIY